MSPAGSTSSTARSWLRVLFVAALVLGLFAMHHVLTSQIDGMSADHAGAQMAASADAGMQMSAVSHDEGHGDDGAEGMPECGGLMLLCVAMIIGVGALIMLRLRTDRVLWQLPPPTTIVHALRIPAFSSLTPLERSCVLRC